MMFGVGAGFQNCQLQGGIARNNTVLNAKGDSWPPTASWMIALFQDYIGSPGISVSVLGWFLLELSTQNLSPPDSQDLRNPSVGPAEPLPNTSLSLGTSQVES